MGTIPEAQDQDLNACERIATILASTPQTLHTLTFSLPYMQHPDTLGDTLRCLAPQVDQAVARFPGLRTITVRVTRSFAAEECMNVARGTLPMKLLDRGVLQIEHKPFHFCKLWSSFSACFKRTNGSFRIYSEGKVHNMLYVKSNFSLFNVSGRFHLRPTGPWRVVFEL